MLFRSHHTSDLPGISLRFRSSIDFLRIGDNPHSELLTMIKVQPVAHGGIDAKIGAKNIDKRKHNPVTTAVSPVLPPSAIPAPDSMNAVTAKS